VKLASPAAISKVEVSNQGTAGAGECATSAAKSHGSVTPETPATRTTTLAHPGPKQRAAEAAIKALGVDLTTVSAKVLFPDVVDYCKEHKSSVPGFSTVEKTIARLRKAPRDIKPVRKDP
jgi:hypothetical protein